ncbi:MAG: AzlD domain-containing protein [Actinobacteria bacterium]|nr:AzlD domain-containing protein [Actinomycetota bacterium]NIS32795.1 AzlD domain-containing protein [Actinomycetota bacterium]NIT96457.1 AzlD domain-containing protein [Actinomycetota bacterium]NIU20154.1 AzlD domain-containing protein [Actinomycetota bacterium]NIU67773.1 AzlD domain-containing protein [Actinomycetota bacterium]
MSWVAIVVLVVGAYGFKALGTFGLARLGSDRAGVRGVPRGGALAWFPVLVGLIPAALFAALIAVQTVETDGALQFDARIAGVGAGAIAVWRRAPFVLVVVLAMAVTAAIRWQTSG